MYKLIKYSTVLVFLSLFLSSCASRVESIKNDVDSHLTELEGYLLLGITSNFSLYEIHIDGAKDIILTKDDLEAGSNYILLNLPAGEYRITKVKRDRNYYYTFNSDEDEGLWNFNVEAETISYVGNLEVEIHKLFWFFYTRAKFELLNQSSYAQEFLEERFPNILKNRMVKYWGPGEDDFFRVINSTKQKMALKGN